MKNQYELILIIRASITEEEKKKQLEQIEKIISKEGKIVKKDEMGKRLLAYKIKGEKDGFYIIFYIELETVKIKILNDKLRLENNIIRHMIVKV